MVKQLFWSDLNLPPINLLSLPPLKVVVIERKQVGSKEFLSSKLVDNPVYEKRKRE